MATLWIQSFASAAEVAYNAPHQQMSLTISGTQATAAVLTSPSGSNNAHMLRVRLMADSDCHVSWAGAATTADTPMGAENPEYFGIEAGTAISVIQRV